MESCKDIKVEIRSRLAIITLNRPKKKNAFSTEMYDGLTKILNDLSEDENIAITALTGTGDYYSSGTQLGLPTQDSSMDNIVSEMSTRIRAFVSAFINHKKILVAVVNGPAIGIAVTTLGLCDIVYCSKTATFQLPFMNLGLCAEGCSSFTFPRIMGMAKASEMILFNHKMTAEEALQVGLVAQVFSKDYIESTLWLELEKKANELPIKSLIYSKELIRHFYKVKLHEANLNECRRLEERWQSEEFMNAIVRFMSRSKL